MDLYAGTSGFSYREWKGPFYPPKLPAAQMLAFYAERLPAVELNNTFYRMPRASVLGAWAEQVPERFRFAIKASRRITHVKRLKEAADDAAYLARQLESLGARLGPVLFQLPPYARKDTERLGAFLEELPPGLAPAFEFRHRSWFEDDALAVLESHAAALCIVDSDGALEVPFVATAPFGYLRLRRPDYDDDDLRAWAGRVTQQGWRSAYVFFKHEDAGAGPRMALRFMEVAENQ